ncbi:uncharacterized protein LOC115079396 [Rhinatrema bivittatum]|uniref:uncharacterized protein LOC115077189 n=1 Tax=Rhinatrema bivittatum TaxID=194408 RepID=UPI00112CAE5D|nr:uncharacterized protein LOC115077189 [Rhinatrema bivittatum]XP_029439197.1 uncharacterized protein LOC115079396 [Rhinatrema bivittatum]
MKIMEGIKQEKYVLLNDDSDLEEFDRSKSALMNPQDGKIYAAKPNPGKCPWLFHVFLILLLITSQATLGVFLLITHWGLERVRNEQAVILRHETNDSTTVEEYNPRDGEDLESRWRAWQHQADEGRGLIEPWKKNISLGQRLNILETHVQFLEMRVSSTRQMVGAPGSESEGEEAKKATDAQLKEREEWLLNLTKIVNSLQRRLEEGLDAAFLHISHLQDEIYSIENSLNYTNIENSDAFKSMFNGKETEKNKAVTDSPLTTSGSMTSQAFTSQQRPVQQQKTTEGRGQIKIPSIKTRPDFQIFFYGADNDGNGFLNYTDILRALGDDAPRKKDLQRFDEDSNDLYSYLELLKAFTLAE